MLKSDFSVTINDTHLIGIYGCIKLIVEDSKYIIKVEVCFVSNHF